jgi:ribosomal protein S18 acetylase RimI-like enzyme
MAMSPQPRQARPEDAPAIAAIWEPGWHDAHDGFVPEELTFARDSASFGERAAQRIGDATVVDVDGEVAGFVIREADEIEQVYVHAAHRGSGVADALMADAEARIRAAGHERAWLAVVGGNLRARRFYERHGWTDEGPFEHLAPGPNGPIRVPAHRYVKRL